MAKSSFSYKITGIKDLEGKLEGLTDKLEEDVDDLVKAAAWDANDDAITNIQAEGAIDLGAGGGLLSGQSVREAGDRSYEVLNSSKHAPFTEWGTGRQVKVEDEWAGYARQYKGPYPGTWDEFEQNIKAWMKRHGIPEQKTVTYSDGSEGFIDVAYFIMLKILREGLPARPFMYPAYIENKEKLLKNIDKLFK